MNYIYLDLELNNSSDNSTPNPKIIQVGISVGNLNAGIILTKEWLIDPGENIYPFITDLTGINNSDIIEKSVSLEVVASELSSIINNYQCFVNPVTWGAGGLSSAINRFKLSFIGKPHRADIDAKNTLLLYFKILERQKQLEDFVSAIKLI